MSFQKLEALRTLPSNWNSYGAEPPNETSYYWAHKALTLLYGMDFFPTMISPSADNGIVISFIDGDKYADIECFNSGEISVVTSDGQGNPTVWEVAPDTQALRYTLEKIREYFT